MTLGFLIRDLVHIKSPGYNPGTRFTSGSAGARVGAEALDGRSRMDTLAVLLDDGLRFGPRYLPDMNSDHLPMVLCAIQGLGGEPKDMVAFRDAYLPQLQEIVPALPSTNWRQDLGKIERYPAVFRLFDEQIAHHGAAEVIRQVLPELCPGLAAEAFHPLIRLGYSITFDSPRESAAALAYLVCSYVAVPCDPEVPIDIQSALSAQVGRRAPDPTGRFGAGLIALLQQNEYTTGCADSLRTCAAVSLDIYRATRNFFALHMVTATHAARACADLVPERQVLAALTGGLLAAHRIVGAPSFGPVARAPRPGSLDLAHALKYVYSCQSEYAAWGDERYLAEIDMFLGAGLVPAWVKR